MKTYVIPGAGLLLIAAGIFGLTLNIDTKFHYFGTGTVFGIGLALVGFSIFKKINKR